MCTGASTDFFPREGIIFQEPVGVGQKQVICLESTIPLHIFPSQGKGKDKSSPLPSLRTHMNVPKIYWDYNLVSDTLSLFTLILANNASNSIFTYLTNNCENGKCLLFSFHLYKIFFYNFFQLFQFV